ncbi:MAG: SNF2-related protein, partial [Hungatella sp.]
DAGDMSMTELTKILWEYRQKKPYYRLKTGEFIKLEDNGLMTVARMVDGLAISKADLGNQKILIPKYRALYMDSLYKENGGVSFYRDTLFKGIVRGMKSIEDSDYEIPPTLQGVLRGYQKTGFRWLRTLDTYGFGGILADDMGLGKTIQIISLLLDEAERTSEDGTRSTSLIICPASLVYNWEYEIHTFAPALTVLTLTGSGSEREEALHHVYEYDAVVTSYDLLKRDILHYESLHFRFQIIDEAQYIKNPVTQSAKAVKMIAAGTRYALTGTPIENRLSELWSIFDYLMPGFLYSYQKFKKTYELPIIKESDKESLKSLHQMIGPFILRRLKKDVLKELPDKLESVVYSKLETEQKNLYMANAYQLKQQLEQQSGVEYGSGKLQVLAELTKLRQICCDPKLHYENYRGESAKLETCMELLIGGVSAGHKILLFSQFTSMLDIIAERLRKEAIAYYMLTGATPKEERLRMVNAFHKDAIPIFLISLKAGGTGLNLTAADMVVHYDPWWNIAAQNQATDRTHRIGQEKQVSVFKLITKDTIEENILRLQESKKNLAEQIITEGTISLSSLTKDDLLKILS